MQTGSGGQATRSGGYPIASPVALAHPRAACQMARMTARLTGENLPCFW